MLPAQTYTGLHARNLLPEPTAVGLEVARAILSRLSPGWTCDLRSVPWDQSHML